MEFLFVTKLWINGEESKLLIDPIAVKSIRDCLTEQTSDPLPVRRGRRPSSATISSSSSNDTLSRLDEMILSEWEEHEMHFPAYEITAVAERSQVLFERRRFGVEEYYSSGLSPNCKRAFYLGSRSIVIYSLERFPEIIEKDVLLRRRPADTENYNDAQAVLTDRFLAITCQEKDSHQHNLLVLEHSSPGIAGKLLGSELIDMHPTCLAMYESGDRTWVMVGGQTNMVGKIQVYRLENVRGSLCLKRQEAQFNKCIPNPLSNDWPKTIDISSDGRRLVCITQRTNKVLVWFLSDHARPRQAAFEISKTYENVSLLDSNVLCRKY